MFDMLPNRIIETNFPLFESFKYIRGRAAGPFRVRIRRASQLINRIIGHGRNIISRDLLASAIEPWLNGTGTAQ